MFSRLFNFFSLKQRPVPFYLFLIFFLLFFVIIIAQFAYYPSTACALSDSPNSAAVAYAGNGISNNFESYRLSRLWEESGAQGVTFYYFDSILTFGYGPDLKIFKNMQFRLKFENQISNHKVYENGNNSQNTINTIVIYALKYSLIYT